IAGITTASSGDRYDVRVKVEGNLLSAVSGGGAAITADNLVLESSDGDIGAATLPVRIDLTGGGTARAGNDPFIRDAPGEMQVVSLLAAGTATLFGDAIVDDNDTAGAGVANIAATSLVLDVKSFGTASNPIEVELDDALAGTVVNDLYVSSTEDLTVD